MNNKNIEIQATVFLKHSGRISVLDHAVTARTRNGKQWSATHVNRKRS